MALIIFTKELALNLNFRKNNPKIVIFPQILADCFKWWPPEYLATARPGGTSPSLSPGRSLSFFGPTCQRRQERQDRQWSAGD